MITDAAALGMALGATRLAERKDRTGQRTYGYYRAEVFAALAVAALMIITGLYVVYAAIRRIGSDVHIETGPMIIVAIVGLAVNLVCRVLLLEGTRQPLPVRARGRGVLVVAV